MRIIITGGAGFIGSNAAAYYLSNKSDVVVFDNLSRKNTDKNLAWLKTLGGRFTFIRGDLRSVSDLNKLVGFLKKADAVLHLAAQVAVTTSLKRPYEDFEINTIGTLRVLELMRKTKSQAKLIYASTNKVYGDMNDVAITRTDTRYEYIDLPHGIHERQPLNFYSPYGCSKGAADQYVHDYSKIYGLDTVVFRQSCIYGPRQFGVEDQGWVAWFMIAALLGKQITVYGDGYQVRDLLYVDDLIRAYELAYKAKNKSRGNIYNIGGGSRNTLSVWNEFQPILERLFKRNMHARFQPERPGDQKIYISDNRKAKRDFGWEPKKPLDQGLSELYTWLYHEYPHP